MKNLTSPVSSDCIQQDLEKKCANQLQRTNDLSINTLEGHLDHARVVNSHYLIRQGIEPTVENLQKLQEDLRAEGAEWKRTHPYKHIERVPAYVVDQRERVTVITEEEVLKQREVEEMLRIIGQSYTCPSLVDVIRGVWDKTSSNGQGVIWGAMATYELGRIHGIRSERKRRVKTLTA